MRFGFSELFPPCITAVCQAEICKGFSSPNTMFLGEHTEHLKNPINHLCNSDCGKLGQAYRSLSLCVPQPESSCPSEVMTLTRALSLLHNPQAARGERSWE